MKYYIDMITSMRTYEILLCNEYANLNIWNILLMQYC